MSETLASFLQSLDGTRMRKNVSFMGKLPSVFDYASHLEQSFLASENKQVHMELLIFSERYASDLMEYCIASFSSTAKQPLPMLENARNRPDNLQISIDYESKHLFSNFRVVITTPGDG